MRHATARQPGCLENRNPAVFLQCKGVGGDANPFWDDELRRRAWDAEWFSLSRRCKKEPEVRIALRCGGGKAKDAKISSYD